MTDTRKQYLTEVQSRYARFLKEEEQREANLRTRVMQEEGLLPPPAQMPSSKRAKSKNTTRQALSNVATKEEGTPPATTQQELVAARSDANMVLGMDRYLPAKFRVYNIILDSTFRNTSQFPDANDFVVKLVEPLKNVAAIRMLRTEFYQPSATTGYFVLNEVRVPLQLYNIESAYLYLNGYVSTNVANDTSTTFFGRIGPGTETYPAVTGNITQDPFIYIMRPTEPRLKRFHVRLLRADGSTYPVANARVVLTLAVYCFMV